MILLAVFQPHGQLIVVDDKALHFFAFKIMGHIGIGQGPGCPRFHQKADGSYEDDQQQQIEAHSPDLIVVIQGIFHTFREAALLRLINLGFQNTDIRQIPVFFRIIQAIAHQKSVRNLEPSPIDVHMGPAAGRLIQ